MITAKCIQASDETCLWLKHDLTVGKEYEVFNIYIGQSHTDVKLRGLPGYYNSVFLEFYEDDKPLNIFKDKRFNMYI